MHLQIFLHAHQPVGNFDFVFEDNYQKSYKPLLDILCKFPDIKLNLHYSGILLQWLESNHPDYTEKLKVLVKNRQVELLSGGFYEPILSSIPVRDIIGQIQKMNDYLERVFEFSPKGLWLTERVWEASLIPIINSIGLFYTVLDSGHFQRSGHNDKSKKGFYITEYNGEKFYIFPNNRFLKSNIANSSIGEYISYLDKEQKDNTKIISVAEDMEALGMWPGNNQKAFTDGWVEKLFQYLKSGNITTSLAFEIIEKEKPNARVYIPSSSYFLMNIWSLPLETEKEVFDFLKEVGFQNKKSGFIQIGYWQNFLVKYEESNLMHKKMLFVSQFIHEKNIKNKDILDNLYQSQCNCAYWHGWFGGIYLKHLRSAIYQHLIKAEKLLIESGYLLTPSAELKDIDYDGNNEYLFIGKNLEVVVSLESGSVISLSDFERETNIVNTIKRYREIYHYELENELTVDNYFKGLFCEYYIYFNNLSEYLNNNEKKSDLVKYKMENSNKNKIRLISEDEEIKKEYSVIDKKDYEILVSYKSGKKLPCVELNLAIFYNGLTMATYKEIDYLKIEGNNKIAYELYLSEKSDIWQFPVFTYFRDDSNELQKEFQYMCYLITPKTQMLDIKLKRL